MILYRLHSDLYGVSSSLEYVMSGFLVIMHYGKGHGISCPPLQFKRL